MLAYSKSPWAHYSECSLILSGHMFENHSPSVPRAEVPRRK